MLVLKRGTTTYIDYVAEVRQREEMTKMLQQFAFKISCLNDIIHKMIHGIDAFETKASFKVNKPKPVIYAMAIFDLVDTWYKFLFPNQPIETEKYQSVKSYVESLGTETEGRAELYKLLDVVYKDPEDYLDNNEYLNIEQNPFSHYLQEYAQTHCNADNNTHSHSHSHSHSNSHSHSHSQCNTNMNNNNSDNTNNTNDQFTELTFITEGFLAGSVRFGGSLSITQNLLDNVSLDNTGNIVVTKNNNNCSKCCCCTCICNSHSHSGSGSGSDSVGNENINSQCYYNNSSNSSNSLNDLDHLSYITSGDLAGSIRFGGSLSICESVFDSLNIDNN